MDGTKSISYTGSGDSVIIPSKIDDKPVTNIRYNAFAVCTRLTNVSIPDIVIIIGNSAFALCANLTIVTIPDNVTIIDEYAFVNCTRLTSITIGNGVQHIGYNVFEGCTSLTSVTFERVDTSFESTGYYSSFIDSSNSSSLQTVYTAGGIGTYTRPNTSSTTWTKTSD